MNPNFDGLEKILRIFDDWEVWAKIKNGAFVEAELENGTKPRAGLKTWSNVNQQGRCF